MFGQLDKELAAAVLRNVSTGLAVFSDKDLLLRWCNVSFKKQTWFGVAVGSKFATRVHIFDLFEKRDHSAILELIDIACRMGQAYDYHRLVRRGPVGAFPAELRFHSIGKDDEHTLICLEIFDLSINKLYEELQQTHAQMRERLADLMSAQAELQFSIRMNTISEFGADLAHHLINPVTICREIIQSQIVPQLEKGEPSLLANLQDVLRYLKDIENFAVWFRKFSNPRISEAQICNLMQVVEDAIILNEYRFFKQSVRTKIRKKDECKPFVFAAPIDLIMWMNAAFCELFSVLDVQNPCIYIDISESGETVTLSTHALVLPQAKERVSLTTLEKLAKRISAAPKFVVDLSDEHISFSLQMLGVVADSEESGLGVQGASSSSLVSSGSQPSAGAQAAVSAASSLVVNVAASSECEIRPLVLIVDDETDIRKLLRRSFKQLGIEVVEAADGQEAFEVFERPEKRALANRIAVVVSDIRMPRMTGPHLLVKLRENNILLPFIFFSSNLAEHSSSQEFKYEKVHYLTKDAGFEELRTLVKNYLEEYRNNLVK